MAVGTRTLVAVSVVALLLGGTGGAVAATSLSDAGGASTVESGPAGQEGPAGADGRDGADGQDGSDGRDGQAGANGQDGEQGPRGERGAVGPAGPAGARGLDGVAGADGRDGADGAVGAQGPQGPPGITGPPGEQGAPGVVPYFYVPLSGATVQSGSNVVLPLVIDQGFGTLELVSERANRVTLPVGLYRVSASVLYVTGAELSTGSFRIDLAQQMLDIEQLAVNTSRVELRPDITFAGFSTTTATVFRVLAPTEMGVLMTADVGGSGYETSRGWLMIEKVE